MKKRVYVIALSVSLIVVILATLIVVVIRLSSHTQASNFVTRSGSQLLLNGQTFRFAGANIYWLGLDSNVDGIQYPTHFRVDDALATAQEMGALVVRAHTLGISVGCSLCIEPSLGKFNETALEHVDYAIQAAKAHGIHLVIPLVDNWRYYHGGKHTFTDWRGVTDENSFFTDKQVIGDFEQYIATILNHVNVYTRLAYKNDPTIMAWETGNEIGAPVSWTRTIADFIKNIDANHLILDGTYGVSNADALALSNVDMYSDHYYPMNISQMNADAAAVTHANKVFYVGEYGWTQNQGDPLTGFLSAVEKSGAVGDTYWSLFGHEDDFGYVGHNDGFTLHYPGDTPDMRTIASELRAHAYRMRSQPLPAALAPMVPGITSVMLNELAWQGQVGDDTYTIERSTGGPTGPWTAICNRCATDNDTPWADTSMPAGSVSYRIKAYNTAGVASAYSAVYEVPKPLIIDELKDWSKAYSHTAHLAFDSTHPELYQGDSARAYRTTATNEEITWKAPGMKSLQAITYFTPNEIPSPFDLLTSPDNISWTQTNPIISGGSGNWLAYIYTLPDLSNVNYVKIRWNNTSGNAGSPQLSRVVIV